MRKLFTILTTGLLSVSLFAQSPEKMSYQAVVRDNSNTLVTNTSVGMQISILQGSASGTAVYIETQTPTTNANGLVSIEIGGGTVVSGTFASIDWANGPYFINTEIDPAGGTNYTITGTSQLLSVPYALHAKTAETITGDITETDPLFTVWDKSTGISITESQISDMGNYIETETDPAVAANFDFTGAATGDLLQFNGTKWVKVTPNYLTTYTETDLIFTNSEAANITAADIINLGNLSGTNTGDQDISGIATNEQAIQDTASQIRADIPTVITYSVGDFAQGGIVFWVDETGQHGLVCAKVDQSTGIRWHAGTLGNTQAKGDGLYAGEANTSIIIAAQVAIGDDGSTYAARICNELQVTEGGKTYGDWYLPSKDELNLMYQNKATIDTVAVANGGSGFTGGVFYWSSTEYDNLAACGHGFPNGSQNTLNKNWTNCVRAVRAF